MLRNSRKTRSLLSTQSCEAAVLAIVQSEPVRRWYADEVFLALISLGSHASMASVYRVLRLMADRGVLICDSARGVAGSRKQVYQVKPE